MYSSLCHLFEELCSRILIIQGNAVIIKPELDYLDFESSYNFAFTDFLKMMDVGLIYKSEIARIKVGGKTYVEATTLNNETYYINSNNKGFLIYMWRQIEIR